MTIRVRGCGTYRRQFDGFVRHDFVQVCPRRQGRDPEGRECRFARLGLRKALARPGEKKARRLEHLFLLHFLLQSLLFFLRNTRHLLIIELEHLLPLAINLHLTRFERCKRIILFGFPFPPSSF